MHGKYTDLSNLQHSLELEGWGIVGREEEAITYECAVSHIGKIAALLSVKTEPEISVVSPLKYKEQGFLANTTGAMGLHTDNVYLNNPCDYLVMVCKQSALTGGETMLCDFKRVLPTIDEEMIRRLRNKSWMWKAPIAADGHKTKNLEVVSSNNQIRWWRHGLLNTYGNLLDIADHFDNILHSHSNNQTFSLNDGDTIVIDNKRVLHSRTAFTGDREIIRGRLWNG